MASSNNIESNLNTFSLETSVLMHPELMDEKTLRLTLQQRGAEVKDGANRSDLMKLYETLVLPKPKRKLDPKNLWHQRLMSSQTKKVPSKLTTSQTCINGLNNKLNGIFQNKVNVPSYDDAPPDKTPSVSSDIVTMEIDPEEVMIKNVPSIVVKSNLKRKVKVDEDSQSQPKKKKRQAIQWP